jgi:hypothetical protein
MFIEGGVYKEPYIFKVVSARIDIYIEGVSTGILIYFGPSSLGSMLQ